MLSVYRKLAVTLDWAIIFVELVTITSAATLIEGPVSVSSLVGENALFHCTGSGIIISWIVDELPHDDPDIVARGISDNTVSLSGTVQSTLTVPATSVNNGTTVQCVLYPGEVTSNNATLTVLPGIGQVVNVRFTPSFSAVLWDHPATVLDSNIAGLSYRVTTMNMNTGQVIVNETTTGTSCPLPDLKLCQNYTANVTVFSYEQQGDSVEAGLRTPGDYYRFESMSQEIVYRESSAVGFLIALRVMGLGIPCPDQRLTVQTYPQSNTSDITNHPELVIMSSGDIVYSITTGIERKQHYTATISLVGNEGIVQVLDFVFSTFEVQDCDISTDHTSILVECIFAINSTAPGIVVLKNDQSQYTRTLQRLQQDSDKGSVNITGLPAGEYSVRVYDNNIISPATDTAAAAAYEHSHLLHIVGPIVRTPVVTSTIDSIAMTPPVSVFPTSSSNISMTPSLTADDTIINVSLVAGVIFGVIAIFVVAAAVVVVVAFIKLRAHKKTRLVPGIIRSNNDRYVRRGSPWPQNHDSSAYPLLQVSFTADQRRPAKYGNNQRNEPDLQHSTDGPIPALPAEPVPVPYANIKKKPPKEPAVYDDSTNPPASPLPAASTVKTQTPDSTVTTQSAAEDKINESMKQGPHSVQHSTDPSATEHNATTSGKTPSAKQKEPDLQHSTNPPAPPLPAELVPAPPKTQTADNTVTTQSEDKDQVDSDLHHSTSPPAPPSELVLNRTQTNNTVTTQSAEDKVMESQEQGSHYEHSTSPSARPLPAEPVLKTQTDDTVTSQSAEDKEANLHHSTDPPAPPLHAELVSVTAGKAPPVNCDPSMSNGKLEASAGYHSASVPIEGPTEPIESTGPSHKVYIQPLACRPDNSQLADMGLLSNSPEGGDRLPYDLHTQSVQCNDTNNSFASGKHVIPNQAAVSTIDPAHVEDRVGVY